MSVVAPSEAAERFVEKWRDGELSERAASHEHFIDLCRVIGVASITRRMFLRFLWLRHTRRRILVSREGE